MMFLNSPFPRFPVAQIGTNVQQNFSDIMASIGWLNGKHRAINPVWTQALMFKSLFRKYQPFAILVPLHYCTHIIDFVT